MSHREEAERYHVSRCVGLVYTEGVREVRVCHAVCGVKHRGTCVCHTV